jgi:hypothetical protein
VSEELGDYQAYLVRLWSTRQGNQVVWRASVEDAHTRERWAFTDLSELFTFLMVQTRESQAHD